MAVPENPAWLIGERPTSSEAVIRDFVRSSIWSDMKMFCEGRIFQARNDITHGTDMQLDTMRYIQGAVKAYEEVLALPDVLLGELEKERLEAETEDYDNA